MRRQWMAAALAALVAVSAAAPAAAADTWDMAYMGRMKLPDHVTFQEGEQKALPFLATGGMKWTMTRAGMLDGHFYTMTYADGTDFSYGWASAVTVGVPYLVKQGETAYRNKTPSEQMDIIAARINADIIAAGADYEGDAPMVRVADKEHPRWEGAFSYTWKEHGVTYHEAYQIALQVSGFRVVLGIINSDGDNTALTQSLAQMMKKRTFYKEKDLLALFLRHG